MSITQNEHQNENELRKLRFDFAKHLTTLNSANILAFLYLADQAKGEVRGEIPTLIFIGGLLCFGIAFLTSIKAMKDYAEGVPLQSFDFNDVPKPMYAGYALLVVYALAIPHFLNPHAVKTNLPNNSQPQVKQPK